MALWTDGKTVFDDMNGTAQKLPSWPTGLTQCTTTQAQAIINPPPTLAQAQAAQITIINNACQNALAAIVAPYPALEIATFPNQLNEAQAFTANANSPTPTLSAIATASGQTVSLIAASVLSKAAAYTSASGALVGKRQALTAQINAATTVTQVQSIVW